MSSEISRQELVSAIESGVYKAKKDSTNKLAATAFVLVFVLMFGAAFLKVVPNMMKNGGRTGFMFGLVVAVFMAFVVFVMILSRLGGRTANLGKLSERDKELILHGDKIEADLDSIDQIRGGYQIRCNANYQGQIRQFASPVIGVRPIPFEERKITVYIDPQNPSKYFVDFYNHIPLASQNNVLQDRSELKCEPQQVSGRDGNAIVIIVAVICSIIMSVDILINSIIILIYILAAKNSGFNLGEIGINIFLLIAIPVFMILAIRSVKNSTDTRKNVMAQGYYIEAVGDRTWTTSDDDGDTTYHLAARYVEPKTKIMHEFTDSSGTSWIRKLVGVKIRVYINPENTKEYVMCSRDAEKNMGFTAGGDE